MKTARGVVEFGVEVEEDFGQDKGQVVRGGHVAETDHDGQELGGLDPDTISSAARASGLAVAVEEADRERFLADHKDWEVGEEG